MQRYAPLILFSAVLFTAAIAEAGLASQDSAHFFSYREGNRLNSAPIIDRPDGRLHAAARIDPRMDPRLSRAASIAEERANARSKMLCWRYVKEALLAAGVVKSYPKTSYALEAGEELTRNYGFTRLSIRDPYSAPVGAVIVYRYGRGGHVEMRTRDGFVSDYHSKNRCFSPVIAVYGKFSS